PDLISPGPRPSDSSPATNGRGLRGETDYTTTPRVPLTPRGAGTKVTPPQPPVGAGERRMAYKFTGLCNVCGGSIGKHEVVPGHPYRRQLCDGTIVEIERDSTAELAALRAENQRLREALADMHAGWRYIRETH